MTTSSLKDETSSYNLLLLSPTIFMTTSKGDDSKDIMRNDCKVVINVMTAPHQEALLVVWGINVMTAPHQEALLVVWGIDVMMAPHQEALLVLWGINVMTAPHPNCPPLDDVVESFPVVGGNFL